ncbi:uncharacterized protein LOC126379979 [Pectinophora gossypiella]|uniref:uncharacterized protein LOC126379979 n=1 Tax=Pectinophora gossypiella TaxID=13191 RepID=UPI00214E9E4F|nr:uncharacterized protein LOC126379979 [Pectinophora gossypiella]
MEEKQLYGGLTVYRERGVYLRRLEQFVKAKAACDEAYKNNPDNVRLLITRSQVCADAVQPQQAYDDAELALKLEPSNMKARKVQANAMYTMSDFERSIVMNYRGARDRQQPPYFTEGISQGLETLQDCIGEHAGNVMLDFYPLIKQQAEHKDNHSIAKTHVSRIPKLEVKKKFTQMEARKHSTLARVLAMKYLGPMAYDKFFLQQLDEDPRISSANSKGSRKLEAHIKEALTSLSERQEMLRTQRPYYTIKRAEKSESKYLTKYRKEILEQERKVDAYNAERLLRKVDVCLRQNNIMDLISKAERMQIFLDTKTPRTLPDKDLYIDRLYRTVGEGYLSLYRLSYRFSDRHNSRRIAFLMGMQVRPSSYDSVVAKFPYKFSNIKTATERLLAQLDMCENSNMRCWLMFELSWLMNKEKNYPLAKFYAKRCQAQAQEIGSTVWWLNACFMLMSGDMQQGNTHEVLAQIEEAYNFADNLLAPDQVKAFLLKCATVASSTTLADDNKAIRDRQKQILRVIDDQKIRTETGVLFKRMWTVPRGRQFNVLPKGEHILAPQSERRRARQRGLSIVPGPEKRIALPPISSVLGFQIFDI